MNSLIWEFPFSLICVKIFGRPVVKKDGSAGTRVVMPPMEVLQRGCEETDTRDQWIQYAVKDAEVISHFVI